MTDTTLEILKDTASVFVALHESDHRLLRVEIFNQKGDSPIGALAATISEHGDFQWSVRPRSQDVFGPTRLRGFMANLGHNVTERSGTSDYPHNRPYLKALQKREIANEFYPLSNDLLASHAVRNEMSPSVYEEARAIRQAFSNGMAGRDVETIIETLSGVGLSIAKQEPNLWLR